MGTKPCRIASFNFDCSLITRHHVQGKIDGTSQYEECQQCLVIGVAFIQVMQRKEIVFAVIYNIVTALVIMGKLFFLTKMTVGGKPLL